MIIKSVFPSWSLLLKEKDRPLNDLDRWTEVNTIELGNFFTGATQGALSSGNEPALFTFPSSEAFNDLTIPTIKQSDFNSILELLNIIKSKGFNITCNVSPLYIAHPSLSSLACVDVTGEEVPGIGTNLAFYGCPNNPDTIGYGEAEIREFITAWPQADMISLNHVEFPLWPKKSFRELFVCFCKFCKEKAKKRGINFEEMRNEITSFYAFLSTPWLENSRQFNELSISDVLNFLIKKPMITTWLEFRLSSMSEYIKRVVKAGRDAAKNYNSDIKIGLEFQLPSFSYFVGTDFTELYSLFDWITPKFPDYLSGSVIPLIAEEISLKTGLWNVVYVRKLIRTLLDLGSGPDHYQLASKKDESNTYSNTFDPSIPVLQMKYLKPLVGNIPIHPYVFHYNQDLEDLKKKLEIHKKNGLDGYMMWVWDRDLSTEALEASEGIF